MTTTTTTAIATMTDDQERIASTKIVYVVAVMGCGKSFIGDYLSVMHAFQHVDGDAPLKNSHIAKNYEMSNSFLKDSMLSVKKRNDGIDEMWQPYFEEIAMQTVDAAKQSNQVVLTHGTYRQTWREFVVKKLIEGGALKENITVVHLTINPDVKLERLYYRTKETVENGGITLGDTMRTQYGWEGDITLPECIKLIKENHPTGNHDFQEVPDGYGKTVDVSGRDMSHLDGVDDALGLVGKRNDTTLIFEEIRDKVKLVDQKRNEVMASTGALEILYTMWGEAKAIAEGDNNEEDNDEDRKKKIMNATSC